MGVSGLKALFAKVNESRKATIQSGHGSHQNETAAS